MPLLRTLAVLAIAVASFCGATRAEDAPMPVVASFSILGDLVKQVGGDRISVTALVGPDGDAHDYQPTPQDARAVAAARLVFVNGLGFEGWMPRLVAASSGQSVLIDVSAGIIPRKVEEEHEHQGEAHGDHAGRTGQAEVGEVHSHEMDDPHIWQSVSNVRQIVVTLRDSLSAADPVGAAIYAANTDAYLGKLDMLNADVVKAIAAIPANRRKIITTHDAFGYFSQAYGINFIAPQGVSSDAEASAADVAVIIRQIRAENIPAVFIENISDPRLMQQIASETSAKIGGTLYSDALSDASGPAGTYIAMMQHNIQELGKALGR